MSNEYPNVKVRRTTKEKIEEFAEARRLDQLEVVEVAMDALNSLSREQQEKFICRPSKRRKQTA